MGIRVACASIIAVAASLALAAHAGPAPAKSRAPIAELAKTLDGADADAALKAAVELGERPEPAAHEALLDALAWGVDRSVVTAAIAALASHPAPPDVVALRRYADYRDPPIRIAALDALAHYPDPAAHVAIVAALHDADAAVRKQAGRAAATGRVKTAIDPLFALLALGDDGAADALALMADPQLVRRLGDQLGKVPEAALAKCLGAILARADFGPDPERVEVVRVLAKIQAPAATQALADYVQQTPANPPRPSRAEAKTVLDARGGGS